MARGMADTGFCKLGASVYLTYWQWRKLKRHHCTLCIVHHSVFLEQCVDSPAIVFVTISVPLSNEINEIATCFCPFGTCPMKDRLFL